MDGIKEIFEAVSARIKSPIIGSIVVAFVIVNWKPLFFLLFSGTPAVTKFAFYDVKMTGYSPYVYPVIIGVAFALLLPFVNFVGAKIVEMPITWHRNMQSDAAHALADRKARQAIDTETVSTEYRRALLKSAEGLQEIKDAKIDEDVRAGLENKLVETKAAERVETVELTKFQNSLPDAATTILTRAAEDASGRISFEGKGGSYFMKYGSFRTNPNRSIRFELEDQISQKEFVLAKEAVEKLVRIGYLKEPVLNRFDLTAKGYSYLDSLVESKLKEK